MYNFDKELNISYLLKEVLIKELMAKVLDFARVSSMSDRQFCQFEKTIKDLFYGSLRDLNDFVSDNKNLKVTKTDDLLPRKTINGD